MSHYEKSYIDSFISRIVHFKLNNIEINNNKFTAMNPLNIIFKVASLYVAITKKSSFNKLAKIEVSTALNLLQETAIEKDPSKGYNRILTHLETAYQIQYESCGKCHFWENHDSIIWKQYSDLNRICLMRVLFQYLMGNTEAAKHILLNNFSNEGDWNVLDSNIAHTLDFENTRSFIQMILGNDFENFNKSIIEVSEDRFYAMEYYFQYRNDLDILEAHLL